MLNFTDASLNTSVQKAAPHFQVAASRKWNCVDEEAKLQLFHYAAEITPVEELTSVRGLVFDSSEEVIVARSYNYTPTAVCSLLSPAEDGSLSFTDLDDNKHFLPGGKYYFKQGFEGTVMRVFKNAGKVYHSSHRRLDTSRSKWGPSPTFLSLYENLGGPKDEELFDSDKDYSPYCYIFLLVHPTLLLASQQDIGEKGFIVYLGYLKLWENKYKDSSIDDKLREFPVVSTVEEAKEGKILHLPKLSLEEANEHLAKGEFIIAYTEEESREDRMPSLLRIASLSYYQRLGVRHNDPNIYHRFVELSSRASTMKKDLFCQEYNCSQETTLIDRYNIILNHYRKCLPLLMQKESESFVQRMLDDRKNLAYWLTGVVLNGLWYLPKTQKIPLRVKEIMFSFNKRKMAAYEIREQINNMLIREPGTSLYKMLRFMKTCKHYEEKNKVEKMPVLKYKPKQVYVVPLLKKE